MRREADGEVTYWLNYWRLSHRLVIIPRLVRWSAVQQSPRDLAGLVVPGGMPVAEQLRGDALTVLHTVLWDWTI